MKAALSAGRAGPCLFALILCCLCAAARGETVTLANGMVLEGSLGKLARLGANPLNPAGPTERLPILVIDNQLTRTFTYQDLGRLKIGHPPAIGEVRIEIDQRVQRAGRAIHAVGPILRIDPFDEWGHRIFSMSSTDGTVNVVQGITVITPKWTQVEAIQGPSSYVWMMRIATSSIPRQQLSKILYRQIDTKNSDQRLDIVRLYMQAERFQDARAELEQVIKDFPGLTRLEDQVKSLHQLSARRLLKEIELRRDAGQYRLAIQMLEGFPADGVAGEMLLQVRETLEEFAAQRMQGETLLKQLDELAAGIKDDKPRAEAMAILAEIRRELSFNTLDRMADYLRLADDAASSPEQKLSLAISGWLLGSGSAVENFGTSLSLVQVRELVRRYLVASRQPDREAILAEMTSLAGATPEYVAKLIAHMKPPVPTEALEQRPAIGNPAEVLGPARRADEAAPAAPANDEKLRVPPRGAPASPPASPDGSCSPQPPLDGGGLLDGGPLARPRVVPKAGDPPAPEPAEPAAAEPAAKTFFQGIPGLLELTTKGIPEDPQLKYLVQLPPQYDPYRRYPCIVTLNGAGTTPLQQVDWWAGGYDAKVQTRFGQATRHGYIVIAPKWTREHQRKYEYSSREHAAVLFTLRDACKRLAIDTDRVFLSGHSMGGDAAWDIGLAHPDLWAGVIPIVAAADKYISHYERNAKLVPLYFVSGEKDGDKLAQNERVWNRYVSFLGYDAMIVQYHGRGHEHFIDEILNLFTWMNLHRRNFFPREFEVDSLRPWDNFFWWVECDKFLDPNMVLPPQWGDKSKTPPRPAQTEARVLATNGVFAKSAAGKVTVWLSPEIVNFDAPMSVTINNRKQPSPQPSVAVLLEDVRTRGDRQHPFWAKAEN